MMYRRAAGNVRAVPVKRWSSAVAAPAFSQVKFQKEEVAAVMTELPEFNFYEMDGSAPYPYRRTLDSSIVLDAPEARPVGKPKVEFAELENGLKIAAVDKGGLKASLGLFVGAGSRHESSGNFGVSHMASLMAYKSTAHLSNLRTVKTLEQLGASSTSTCVAGREDVTYQVDVMREYMPLVLPLMVGNVLFPRLLPWEVKAAHGKVKQAREAMAADPGATMGEIGHKAAYCNNTLGFSPVANDRSMSYFTPDTIRSYLLDHFAPERMVLVGVNVDAADLSKWAMRSFVDYNAIPMKERADAKANYTGGDIRVDGPGNLCHVAIALESTALGQADSAAVAVLQTLLGGGSAGNATVGGGSLSRVSRTIVKQNPFVHSCIGFNKSYSDSGLFGIYGSCQADAAGGLADQMIETLVGLTTITEAELNGAKAVLKGKVLRQLDNDAALLKDIGAQLLHTGAYQSPEAFSQSVDEVTIDSVTAAAAKILSSNPTVIACGDTHALPHHSYVAAALK